MTTTQAQGGAIFRDLHEADSLFVMPNAWNAGSACLLEEAGFAALGTTSAGIAFSAGLPDYEGVLSRDDAMAETARICAAVDVPVSADAENGYGDDPEAVADCIRAVAASGAVGANIEDCSAGYVDSLYQRELAVERIRAARAAADALDFPFTLTARAECYLVGHPEPFAESVVRANLYREAGADCLFVPGIAEAATIDSLVREVDGPVSVVMGLSGAPLGVTELEDLGVRRISIGGSLARATFGLIRDAAREILDRGSFGFAQRQIPDAELCRFFSARLQGRGDGA